ncbi:MAG: HD domain-containing phosphohydrolase [Candidatus Sericytochromatia bacterium]|nr:HD domain-containing phosphohydrolase [Candidatus Sericytochromatia bacterium]
MSDELIAPGKRLQKPLIHPSTGNVLLPAGTVLSSLYIERLTRQGLESHLKTCMEGYDPLIHDGGFPRSTDLDSFEIHVPELPAILFEYAAAVNVQLSAPVVADNRAPAFPPTPSRPWVPSPHDSTSTGDQLPPVPPLTPVPTPVNPSGLEMPPPVAAPVLRYHHNPQHALSERFLLSAMAAIEKIDAELRDGKLPSYPSIATIVQEVCARLNANPNRLNDGLELRIVNQAHHRSHPVNVMTLSIAMGIALGYDNKQLFTLGVAALCHDIGKSAIPYAVLDKQGPLEPQEAELLRAHPSLGKRIMEKLPWATPEMARIVYEHHERIHGGGYPTRLRAGQIHDMAKVVAVAEVYDALVSDTSYRPRYAPEFSYVTVRNGERMGLDPNVLKIFAKVVYPYPLNSFVIMADQRMGQVVQNNRQDPLRPVVRIKGQIINLMDSPQFAIKDLQIQAF